MICFWKKNPLLDVFWPRPGLQANHGTVRKSAIFSQPSNQKQLKWSNTAYVNKWSFTFKIKLGVFRITRTKRNSGILGIWKNLENSRQFLWILCICWRQWPVPDNSREFSEALKAWKCVLKRFPRILGSSWAMCGQLNTKTFSREIPEKFSRHSQTKKWTLVIPGNSREYLGVRQSNSLSLKIPEIVSVCFKNWTKLKWLWLFRFIRGSLTFL